MKSFNQNFIPCPITALFAFFLFFSLESIAQSKANIKKADSLKVIAENKWQKNFDSTAKVYTIRSLTIQGNKKTKNHIINRELVLEVGYTASWNELYEQAKVDENKVFNLQLFLEVYIYPKKVEGNNLDLLVVVKERWYTFGFPVLDIGSRNFNDWFLNQGGDGSRINYGVKIRQENMRGQRETLDLRAQGGFSKVFGLGYHIPSINKKQTLGLRIYGDYTEVQNVSYQLKDNKEVFLETKRRASVEYFGLLQLAYRESFFKKHTFSFAYKNINIDPEVLKLNPNYLLYNRSQRQYLSFRYKYALDKRDRQNYALQGYAFFVSVRQIGLGILDNVSQFNVQVDYAQNFSLKRNYFFSFRVGGKISHPGEQPFYLNRTLGYNGNFIRGYEVYSFTGEHFALGKFNLKKKLLSTKIYINNILNINQFNEIPLDMYLKVFSDHAYTYQKNVNYELFKNVNLINRFISSIGLGLDIVTYYDIVVRLETSYNSINEVNYAINISSDLFN